MTHEERASEEQPRPPILPSSRRIIIIQLGITLVVCVIGMSWGKLPIPEGMVLTTLISAGFIGLLKGGN